MLVVVAVTVAVVESVTLTINDVEFLDEFGAGPRIFYGSNCPYPEVFKDVFCT